jgi:hypothetical protein
MEHLLDRIQTREIDADALRSFAAWLNSNPEVPEGSWYKRFPAMTVCGEGALVKTFLASSQAPLGEEILF